MFETRTLIVLIVGLPLLASIVTAALGPRLLRAQSHWPTIVALVLAFVCSLGLGWRVRSALVDGESRPGTEQVGLAEVFSLWTWANVDDAYEQPAQDSPDAGTVDGESRQRRLAIDVSLRVDPLTVMMLITVTFVAGLVAIYSVGYMHDDPGYWRFFAYVSLFAFSMTMLVSVSNFLLLYVFWEAVGVCSYLLIGFWYQKPEAAAAGKKAFLVNRVGDFGFALGVFLIWTAYGTLNFHDTADVDGVFGQARLSGAVGFVGDWRGMAICLLLLIGACGKSAQFPLHVWLPDAMEGPTPVSALIHAATMVTAGIYMITRCTPLFMAAPDAQLVVACVGAGTALMAGIIALTQFDLKRILAYSTISQLGYMFLGLGTGTLAGISAGMFHLFTHAFFKALLFLGAGSVMHAMGGIIDVRRFGGLRRVMPITHWTFACGCLALAGLFPFAGFWSKDAIVGSVHEQSHAAAAELDRRGAGPSLAAGDEGNPLVVHGASTAEGHGHRGVSAHLANMTGGQLKCRKAVYQLLFYVALFTALLTAIYTFRAFFLTFYGEVEIPREAGDHAHESPPSMWVPLSILSAFALAVGFLGHQQHLFASFIGSTPSLDYHAVQQTPHPAFHFNVALTSSIVAIVGIGLAAFLYLGDRREVAALEKLFDFQWLEPAVNLGWARQLEQTPLASAIMRGANRVKLGWLVRLLCYFVLALGCLLTLPLMVVYYLSPYRLSRHKFYFDEIYNALIVWPLRGLAWLSYAFDRWVIDGIVNLCGLIPPALGVALRGLQMGLVSFYGLAMVLGLLTLLLARAIWGGG